MIRIIKRLEACGLQLAAIFTAGLFISFMGTLPLGTLNVLAARIAVNEGISPAVWFSLGALLVEMCYVRLSLAVMDRIRRWKKWMRVMEGLTVIIILILALGSFRAAADPHSGSGAVIGIPGKGPLRALSGGLLLSAVNPLQIPFWFGWSTLLFQQQVLLARSDHYRVYILGIGLGTFAGNAVFIAGGHLFVRTLSLHRSLLDGIIGGIFLVTAMVQLVKLLRHKGAAENM